MFLEGTAEEDDDELESAHGHGDANRDVRETNAILQDIERRSKTVLGDGAQTQTLAPQHKRAHNTLEIDLHTIQTLADGSYVVRLGTMEIWDTKDLATIRETFLYLFHTMQSKHFGLDMSSAQYVPSGFFGMLSDWHDLNVQIQLYFPQPQIREMVWFKACFHSVGDGVFGFK